MNLEIITLSEISQRRTNIIKHLVILSRKKIKADSKCNLKSSRLTENKVVLPVGRGKGGEEGQDRVEGQRYKCKHKGKLKGRIA